MFFYLITDEETGLKISSLAQTTQNSQDSNPDYLSVSPDLILPWDLCKKLLYTHPTPALTHEGTAQRREKRETKKTLIEGIVSAVLLSPFVGCAPFTFHQHLMHIDLKKGKKNTFPPQQA